MKIAQLTPGSGDNFYCENCKRDLSLIRALGQAGHDITMVPMYLPVADKQNLAGDSPIFFGGINVYLQQKFSFFRKTPRWLDSMFDVPGLLRWVGKKSSMTSSKDLGETTISMLLGSEGRQVKELERLIDWLGEEENKPDIVCLSNILLGGLARRIRERLGVPIVCLLQDEDGFVDGLGEPYTSEGWRVLAKCAENIDMFISVSRYYAKVMEEKLGIDKNKMQVVYMGIPLADYKPSQEVPKVPTIGYLSRTCSQKGLDELADCFINIKRKEKFKTTKLRISGGATHGDKKFIDNIRDKLRRSGFIEDVDFLPLLRDKEKLEFLRSISVMCVPEKAPVAYGLYVLESLACAVPAVEPATGVFNELLELTGGGVLYDQNKPNALQEALESVLLDAEYARKLGRQGRESIIADFDIKQTAEKTIRIYKNVCGIIDEV